MPSASVERKLPLALETIAQGLALDVRHRVNRDVRPTSARIVAAAGCAGGCSPAIVWISRANRSAPERRREIGVQHLDRHAADVLHVVREIHRRHPPAADLALDAVPIAEGGAQRGEHVVGERVIVGVLEERRGEFRGRHLEEVRVVLHARSSGYSHSFAFAQSRCTVRSVTPSTRGLRFGEAAEEATFHDARESLVLRAQARQRVVDGEQRSRSLVATSVGLMERRTELTCHSAPPRLAERRRRA